MMPLTFRELQTLPTARTPTPNQRAGILVWDRGFTTGRPHSHHGAIEFFYFFQGDCRMKVGPEEKVVRQGQIAWVPPEAPHLMSVEGDTPLGMFLIVTPNLVPSHTPPEDFAPGADHLTMKVYDAQPGLRIEQPPFVRTEVVELRPGATHRVAPPPGGEAIAFVMGGRPHVTVGPLAGDLPTYGEFFAPPGVPHEFRNLTHDPVRLLLNVVFDDPRRPTIDTR
jgi:quercetin dioxygenase-like cupin family protein